VRLSPESLAAALARGLRNAYLVTGVEPLLIAESCDAIRARARTEGYGEREVHFIERGFRWHELLADTSTLSLFAERRLIELRLSGALDAEGSRVLQSLVEQPPPDTVLLVSGAVERKALKNAWIAAFEKAGVLVIAEAVPRRELPAWILRRLARQGVVVEQDAAEFIADRVEGNLLAAQQEIERIALLSPAGAASLDEVTALVADSARFDVFELAGAALSGNAGRALRILAGLRAEGEEPPLILWALTSDLRAVSRVAKRLESQRSLDDALRAEQVWSNRQGPVRAALQRLQRTDIDALIVAAGRADLLAKGGLRGDPWIALESLVARLAGVPLAA
jgi:DNA polymerase-3 subunit delta